MNDESIAVTGHPGVPASTEYPPPPELGDVIDALDDAAASLKVVVKNGTKSIVDDISHFVHRRPLAAVVMAGAAAYLVGRLSR